MRPAWCLVIVVVLAGGCALGQTRENLAFEVASIKQTPPVDPHSRVFFGPPHGGPGTDDPGPITWTGAYLKSIVTTAFDVEPFQIDAPDWMANERYDIVVKIPDGATKIQVISMWQN